MISKEEVRRIAKLARLELEEKEAEKMQKDLSGILDYFEQLKKAPKLAKGEPGPAAKDGIAAARKDEIVAQKRETAEKIIAALPDKKDGYIKVKAIL